MLKRTEMAIYHGWWDRPYLAVRGPNPVRLKSFAPSGRVDLRDHIHLETSDPNTMFSPDSLVTERNTLSLGDVTIRITDIEATSQDGRATRATFQATFHISRRERDVEALLEAEIGKNLGERLSGQIKAIVAREIGRRMQGDAVAQTREIERDCSFALESTVQGRPATGHRHGDHLGVVMGRPSITISHGARPSQTLPTAAASSGPGGEFDLPNHFRRAVIALREASPDALTDALVQKLLVDLIGVWKLQCIAESQTSVMVLPSGDVGLDTGAFDPSQLLIDGLQEKGIPIGASAEVLPPMRRTAQRPMKRLH